MYSSPRPPAEHGSAPYPHQNSTSPAVPPGSGLAQAPSQAYHHVHPPAMSGVPSVGGPPHSPLLNRGHPASPLGYRPLPAPSVHSQERQSTGYYDPVMEARRPYAEPSPHQHAGPRSPLQTRHMPYQGHDERSADPISYSQPPLNGYGPPPSMSRSLPPAPGYHTGPESSPAVPSHQTKSPNISRSSNPMSMSNLLSDNAPEPAPVAGSPAKLQSRQSSRSIDGPGTQPPRDYVPVPPPMAIREVPPPMYSPDQRRASLPVAAITPPRVSEPHPPPPPPPPPPPQPVHGPPELSVRGTEAAYAGIEARELSDIEALGYDTAKEDWLRRQEKRKLDVEFMESARRKRRRKDTINKYYDLFAASMTTSKEAFVAAHERKAEEQVKDREIEEEKERKKDMQRKRRRERTLQNENSKLEAAVQKLEGLSDAELRVQAIKEIQRAGKKIRNTKDLLHGKIMARDLPGTSPPAAGVDGGSMSMFALNDEEVKPRKTGKGTRPRKSREQKLAEKENAAAGQAALDRGDELPSVATKDEQPAPRVKAESRVSEKPQATEVAPYTSKGYNQIYEQIWKDLAKAHVNKVFRIRNTSLDTKQSNMRKTGQLAAKEARRWQIRTNKSTKDIQARAKRSMKEVLSFWKRNERDERDQRKMAERQELENARKAEADREAARQKRKLNFLISQTELYSHFIGKKVKTDELERSTDDATVAQSTKPAPSGPRVDLPDGSGKIGGKVTNFEDLDFDNEDESVLREAAMANAQNAVKEAQDRARAFNNEGEAPDEDGEMNFQNPTSLQTMDVEQPKMLTCQLKEYQLKGLNWLVNLYEQGINGILADEMGLGKTVQSISVMAYLAEVHNIWGPFLVIAPASTLHNWQQEITKFVPTLKVLPYWGNAKDRKVLRKFWDRKHITYTKESSFHVLITSYQLVVQDTPYFQKIKWQYMILDEAQAIKSSQSSRWKALLGFHCRNRLLLTGTPIQNNMQELWALLHFIMPSLFDSHDEFSDWFSKDIESHAQSNTKLNEDQLKRLHMILKPFMLRRVKKHVQKELGDKIEEDVFCDMTYRQRAYYTSLRNKISFMDLIEKAAVGDDQDTASLMNLVMQFRKVCNHPDLFERADITSPLSLSTWAETASFMREGFNINVSYSVKSSVEYWIPKRLISGDGRLDLPGPESPSVGWRQKYLKHDLSIWHPQNVKENQSGQQAFSWLRFIDSSPGELSRVSQSTLAERIVDLARNPEQVNSHALMDDSEAAFAPGQSMLKVVESRFRRPLVEVADDNYLQQLYNVSRYVNEHQGFDVIEKSAMPKVSAPPIELICPSQHSLLEKENAFFNIPVRRALYPISPRTELALLEANVPTSRFPVTGLLPKPDSEKQRYTKIQVPSMRRFVSDCGKLAKLDELLLQLKAGGHRVLLYFQMTRMIDLMEEYLTYRNYKYCRLDGSTKLEDRRDTVAAFQSDPSIFVFLLSTRAGGLGINLVAADTVIFYDSDWNPTIDSQAMDRAHRLGQTRQVTVYRLITRGTIEERIRKRALQKEEVQRVVISGGAPAGGDRVVDFNARSTRDNRTKDIALWLADDDEAAAIEKREAELAEQEAKDPGGSKKKKRDRTGGAAGGRKKEVSMDDMYHEGEGRFDDDNSNKPSGAATPNLGGAETGGDDGAPPKKKRKGISKKAKTIQQRLAVADGQVDGGF